MDSSPPEEEDASQAMYDKLKNSLLDLKVKLRQHKRRLETKIQEEQEARRHNNNASSSTIRLPRLELPKFDGKADQ